MGSATVSDAVRVRQRDRLIRAPEPVVVLGVEARDHRVAAGDVRQRQHASRTDEVQTAGGGETQHAVVPLADVVVGPEQRLAGLRRRPARAVDAAQIRDLVDVVGVPSLVVRRGRPVGTARRSSARGAASRAGRGRAPAPARAARRRAPVAAGRGPQAWCCTRGRRSRAAPARLARPSHRRRSPANSPCRPGWPPGRRRGRRRGRLAGAELWLQAGERVVRRGRDRRLRRGVCPRGERDCIRPVATLDRHRRVVDGDVHDAHEDRGLARELGAEVLRTEDPARSGRNYRAPGLRAPERDRCPRGRVVRRRRALRRLRRCSHSRPGTHRRDRRQERDDKSESRSHDSFFLTRSPRWREAARALPAGQPGPPLGPTRLRR